jgi:hypothetical protein
VLAVVIVEVEITWIANERTLVPAPEVTCAWNVALAAAAVGVPERAPSGASTIPAGRAPETTTQVEVPLVFDAVRSPV